MVSPAPARVAQAARPAAVRVATKNRALPRVLSAVILPLDLFPGPCALAEFRVGTVPASLERTSMRCLRRARRGPVRLALAMPVRLRDPLAVIETRFHLGPVRWLYTRPIEVGASPQRTFGPGGPRRTGTRARRLLLEVEVPARTHSGVALSLRLLAT